MQKKRNLLDLAATRQFGTRQMDTSIAKAIISQLGGNRFAVMTGVKNFIALENGVKFNIGKNATRANLVIVKLTAMDDYVVEFWQKGRDVNPYTILMKMNIADYATREAFNAEYEKRLAKAQKNAEPKMLKSVSGVYCDTIQEVFTDYTKLYTRLF